VLGQIGGALELAEQISAGLVEDVSRIYLPIGSGCTLTGLTIGTAIARQIGLNAFLDPDFKIIGCPVGFTPVMSYLHGDSSVKMRYVPGSLAYGIEEVCQYIVSLGGPDYTLICHESHRDNMHVFDEKPYSQWTLRQPLREEQAGCGIVRRSWGRRAGGCNATGG